MIEIERYLERIGLHGPLAPSVETLHALTAAHAQSIPFENLDVLLGRPIRLDAQALYQKLVRDRRGGYCFEQNGLLLEILTQLGFSVRPMAARVRLGTRNREEAAMRTHLVLEVTIDGVRWITDVGVGSTSLTRALQWVADREQVTPHDTRRLQHEGARWFHQVRHGAGWIDVYEWDGQAMPMVDRIVSNWYTSTHPNSKFRRDLMVALARADGGRTSLHNHELSVREADGTERRQVLADDRDLLAALDTHFGITLAPDTIFPLGEEAAG